MAFNSENGCVALCLLVSYARETVDADDEVWREGERNGSYIAFSNCDEWMTMYEIRCSSV